jgi:hypothetical protein
MIPMSVGGKPRKNPETPSWLKIVLAISMGCPVALLED